MLKSSYATAKSSKLVNFELSAYLFETCIRTWRCWFETSTYLGVVAGLGFILCIKDRILQGSNNKSTGTASVLWNKKYMFCVNVMSVFFVLAATYRDDYKIKENWRIRKWQFWFYVTVFYSRRKLIGVFKKQ